MEFKKTEDVNFIDYQFDSEPSVNVIDEDAFEERVAKVFNILWEKLSKSFGPGGAGAFISVYPSYFNTKDGFTIMKNIAFDKKLDQVICDIAMSICRRLNFTVGDGTTTAIIATNTIYKEYYKIKEKLKNENILPKNILDIFDNIKDILLKDINEKSISIQTEDSDKLKDYISKVVDISSNGDISITESISNLYEELKYPAITVTTEGSMSATTSLPYKIINGYNIDVSLTDKLYINNDNSTLLLDEADFIIFDHKVDRYIYDHILKSLAGFSTHCGRKLVCIAPFYDEYALDNVISKDLLLEYKRLGTISLVLTTCTKLAGISKVKLNDLAMLLNTTIITKEMASDIIKKLNSGTQLTTLFNVNNRNIKNSKVVTSDGSISLYNKDTDVLDYKFNEKDGIVVGYARKSEIGLSESTFSGFCYDEKLYNQFVEDAKDSYEEIRKKCETMGVFSIDMVEKQKRYYSLKLKTGVIEVTADSELSLGYKKDVVDDSVKAAASAYDNGIVPGCSLTILRKLKSLKDDTNIDETTKLFIDILYKGFYNVYKTVLSNVMVDEEAIDNIINKSIDSNVVYDIRHKDFTGNVINSAETDKEILKAIIDLISLLITGNQLVLR